MREDPNQHWSPSITGCGGGAESLGGDGCNSDIRVCSQEVEVKFCSWNAENMIE